MFSLVESVVMKPENRVERDFLCGKTYNHADGRVRFSNVKENDYLCIYGKPHSLLGINLQ